jgi:hypothetical protein
MQQFQLRREEELERYVAGLALDEKQAPAA